MLIIILEFIFLSFQSTDIMNIIVMLHIGISSIVVLAAGYLILFHIWLRINNITTYQYILNKRSKKSNKVQQEKPKIISKINFKTISTIENQENFENFIRNKSMIDRFKLDDEILENKINKTQEIIKKQLNDNKENLTSKDVFLSPNGNIKS